MRGPTPIPDTHTYGVAVLVVGSLGCLSIAVHAQAWVQAHRRVSFVSLYLLVMAAVIAWSCVVIDPRVMTGSAPWRWAAAIPAGAAAGALVVGADRWIVRWFARRWYRTQGRARAPAPQAFAGAAAWQADMGTGSGYLGLAALLLVGTMEELIFRGVLVQLSLELPAWPLVAGALAATLAVFAVMHLAFGWANVASKTILGAGCLAATLLLGTVVVAVAAHVTFNAVAWARVRPSGGRGP